ncbi:hypothetical protein Ga0123462_1606 [Mariprofundus ferrinatatus]|uniref:Uncharacterized protein n=2 Tax=Mariprofundus ferrinatatus TaxID=1921087 RepID=A0A2K8LC40_9PROT|nr:hypothetical protein Ga0123462_1606 [Mariprofundus ferrinatatus]
MEMLSQYLIHYSDLFQDTEFSDEADFAEWEEGLEQHMADLLEGDVEPSSDLGMLPLDALDPEHLRDFLGWFAVRESSNAELIQAFANVLQAWIKFIYQRGWFSHDEYRTFHEELAEVAPDAVRVARLSRVLFHFVRTGGGVSPRLRGKRFSRFVEGHGRIVEVNSKSIVFDFDNMNEKIGPVLLPQVILEMIEEGDVFDVELGLRDDSWVIVDVGPVYPASVYVEVEEYQGLEKIS